MLVALLALTFATDCPTGNTGTTVTYPVDLTGCTKDFEGTTTRPFTIDGGTTITITMTNCKFSNVAGAESGGLIRTSIQGLNLIIIECDFTNIKVSGITGSGTKNNSHGGVFSIEDYEAEFTMNFSTIVQCGADYSGSFATIAKTKLALIEDCTFRKCELTAATDGGSICLKYLENGNADISNCVFEECDIALCLKVDSKVNNCSFSHNVYKGTKKSLYALCLSPGATSKSYCISDCSFVQNNPGAIYINPVNNPRGDYSIENCEFKETIGTDIFIKSGIADYLIINDTFIKSDQGKTSILTGGTKTNKASGHLQFQGCCFQYISPSPADFIYYLKNSDNYAESCTVTFTKDNCIDMTKDMSIQLISAFTVDAPDGIFKCTGCGIELPKESEIVYSEIINPEGCPSVPITIAGDENYIGCSYIGKEGPLFTLNSGVLNLEKCSFKHISISGLANSGSIISATSNTPLTLMKIIDCTFENCDSGSSIGGMVYITSTLDVLDYVKNTIVSASDHPITGLAIYTTNTKKLNISKCISTDTGYDATSSVAGGIFYASGDSIFSVEECQFENCKRCIVANSNELNVIGSSFTNCLDFTGSCVYVSKSSKSNINIEDCNFTTCNVTNGINGDKGGAVFISETNEVLIDQCNFFGCTAKYGGGIYCEKSNILNISNNKFVECYAISGGAIEESLTNKFVEFRSNTFIDNNVKSDGASVTLMYAKPLDNAYIIIDNYFTGSCKEFKLYKSNTKHNVIFTNNHFERKTEQPSITGQTADLRFEKNCFTVISDSLKNSPFIELEDTTSSISLSNDNCFASTLENSIKPNSLDIKYSNLGIFECSDCKNVPFIPKQSDEPSIPGSFHPEIPESYVDLGCPEVPYTFSKESTLEDCAYENKNVILFNNNGGHKLTINKCNFTSIKSTADGSVISCIDISESTQIEIIETVFDQCESTGNGGIAYITGTIGRLTISNIQVKECKASKVYGFYVAKHNSVKISDSTISKCSNTGASNTPAGFFSGLKGQSSNVAFIVENCQFSTCTDTAITISFPEYSIKDCEFNELTATVSNGAIYFLSSNVNLNGNIENCKFVGCKSSTNGACIVIQLFTKRDIKLTECVFSKNEGKCLIYSSNVAAYTLTLEKCNFSESLVESTIYLKSSSTINIQKCCLQSDDTSIPFAKFDSSNSGTLVFDEVSCIAWNETNIAKYAALKGADNVFNCIDCEAGPPTPLPEPPIEPSYIDNPEGCPTGPTTISSDSSFSNCRYNRLKDMFKFGSKQSLTLTQCEFSLFSSSSAGCVIYSDITETLNVKVDRCKFIDCENGIIKMTSIVPKFELLNSKFTGNSENSVDGYAVNLEKATEFDVKNCIVKVKQGEAPYGGIFYTDGTGSMLIEECTFDTCSRCVVGRNSNIVIKSTDFTSCSDIYGSAIYIPSNRDDPTKNVNELSIIGCKFIKCVSNKGIVKNGPSGGAITIYSATTLSVNGSLFEECVANYGGGLYFSKCNTVLIAENTFTKCNAFNGGGFEDAGTKTSLLIYNNTFKENLLTPSARGSSICLFGSPAPTDLSKIEMNTFINGQSDIFINPNKGTRTGDIIINNTFTKSGEQPSIECYSLQLTLDNNCFKSNPGATGEVKGFYLYESDGPTNTPSVITIKANNCFDKTHAESIKSKGDNEQTQIIVENENVFGCNTCYSGVEPQPPVSEKPEDIGGQTKEGTDIPPGGIAGIVIAAIVVVVAIIVVAIIVVAVVCSKKKGGGHSDYIANNAEEL